MRFSFKESILDSAPKVRMPVEIKTCKEYLGRMREIRKECEKRGLIPVYHYTLPAAAEAIAEKGFRYSFHSVKDVGIYFTTLSPASYGLGCSEYEENLTADTLNPENLQNMRGGHKFDACFVYAAEPRVLRQAPGGRNTSVMVPQVFLEILSEPEPRSRDFLLRPDRIVACLLLDPAKPLTDYDNYLNDMKVEEEIDKKLTRKLALVKIVARYNELISKGEHGLAEGQTPWPRMDMVSRYFQNGQHLFGENEMDPMIFGNGDFGVPDWASLMVDIDGAGGVKIRDLPQMLSFDDDRDPNTLVGLNVHLKSLDLTALNDWTGVVKAWKSGDGAKQENSFIVALDAGLPGFLPGFEFSCEGRNLEVAQEQGEKNKPRPRGEARLKVSASDTEMKKLDPKRRAILRARTARRKFALLDSAEAVEFALEEQEEKQKTKDSRQKRSRASLERESRKWESAGNRPTVGHLRSAEESRHFDKVVNERLSNIREAEHKQAGEELSQVAAAEHLLERLDQALDAWQVKVYGNAWEKWVAVLLAARAKDAVADFEANEELKKEARQKRRDLGKWRHLKADLRRRGDAEAIAEFDAHVITIIGCGGLSKFAIALKSIRLRLSLENWKMHTIKDIEACIWRRCVTEFTRKNGFPPKPGCLWMLSSLSAKLLQEPMPIQLSAGVPNAGMITEAAAITTTMENRKALRGLRRDARKLAKIRDKLEEKEPPSGLLKKFIESSRPEDNWRLRVGGSDSGGKQRNGGVIETKTKVNLPSKSTARRRSSSSVGEAKCV
jgi:hypothetical protein